MILLYNHAQPAQPHQHTHLRTHTHTPPTLLIDPGMACDGAEGACNRHLHTPLFRLLLRWEFIKESKKVRKQELYQKSDQEKKKTRTQPRKRSRKQENKNSTKKKEKTFFFP